MVPPLVLYRQTPAPHLGIPIIAGISLHNDFGFWQKISTPSLPCMPRPPPQCRVAHTSPHQVFAFPSPHPLISPYTSPPFLLIDLPLRPFAIADPCGHILGGLLQKALAFQSKRGESPHNLCWAHPNSPLRFASIKRRSILARMFVKTGMGSCGRPFAST